MPRGRDRGVEGCWVCSNRCCSNASCPCPGPSISCSSIGQCGKGPAASSACRNSMACLLPLLMWLHTFLLYYKIDPHICCCLLYIYCFFFLRYKRVAIIQIQIQRQIQIQILSVCVYLLLFIHYYYYFSYFCWLTFLSSRSL